MIDRAPQIHMLASDPDDHFVEMPAIARSRTAPPQTPSDRRSEFEHPTANALVGNGLPGCARSSTVRCGPALGPCQFVGDWNRRHLARWRAVAFLLCRPRRL